MNDILLHMCINIKDDFVISADASNVEEHVLVFPRKCNEVSFNLSPPLAYTCISLLHSAVA